MLSKRAIIIWVCITALWLGASLFIFGQSKSNEQEQKPQESIKLDTALVTVPVIVTDRYGRFVTGLDRRDFLVREDGAAQEITNLSSIEAPFNVALLIDTSRSTLNKLSSIRKAARTFIKQLQPRDRVLIVSFDERVQFHGDFTNDQKELERAISKVKTSYLTTLYDAIHRTVTEKLMPLPGRKAIVVLSDGVDTWSRQATYESTLDLISSSGIITYAIQYETRNDGGPLINPSALPQIKSHSFFSPAGNYHRLSPSGMEPQLSLLPGLSSVSAPQTKGQVKPPRRDPYLIAADYFRALALQSGARYIRAENIENTSYAFAVIADELRHQYTLTYYSTNEKRDGQYRAIEVSVKRNDLSVRARQGYRAPKAAPPATTESKESEKKTEIIKQ
jgi:VWFA-related protein